MRFKRISLIIGLFIILCFFFYEKRADAARLMQENDLSYLGAFRVPKGDLGGGSLSNGEVQGNMCLTYVPSRNSLIMGTSPTSKKIVEISIPQLMKANTIEELATADLIQNPVDITSGNWNKLRVDGSSIPEYDGGTRPGGYLIFNDSLLGSAYAYYDASGTNGARSHFKASYNWTNEGTKFEGMYRVGYNPIDSSLANGGFVGGYMAIVPESWQESLGGPVITGASSMPIVSRTSLGPCAWSFDPDKLGITDPVPATMLLGYTINHPTLGEYEDEMHFHYNRGTGIKGVVFPEGFDSLLFFGCAGIGQTGHGDSGYGHTTHTQALHNTFPSETIITSLTSSAIVNGAVTLYVSKDLSIYSGHAYIAKPTTQPNYHMAGTILSYNRSTGALILNSVSDYSCGKGTGSYSSWNIHISPGTMVEDRLIYNMSAAVNEKGGNSYPNTYRVWCYDANELAKVKDGYMKPWDVKPYDAWSLALPFTPKLKDISGAAYDPKSQRIFLIQGLADVTSTGTYPLIHVYKVNGITAPTGVSIRLQ